MFKRLSDRLPHAGSFAADISVAEPGRLTPLAVRVIRRFISPLVRVLFRPRWSGLEHLPKQGPYLLVANHSGGTGIAEILSLLALYVRDVGVGRPIAGFALPLAFRLPGVAWVFRQVGAVPSHRHAADSALNAGVPLLIFPGGDYDTLRPVWLANKVDFGGRKGFLRIARDHQIPIVPLGIRGSHYTAPMLLRAKWLAWALVLPRLMGIKRFGISLLGVLGCVGILAGTAWPLGWQLLACWAWLASPLVLLPWLPWTIRMRVSEPLDPPSAVDDGALHAVERAVKQALEAA